MSLRSWAIRGLILTGVAALAAVAWIAHSWVSPERVRAQVIAQLTEQFEDVDVHVGSARMRILGGIAVNDLTLTRRGSSTPFLVVPSAVLYHDKEQLNRGRLVIKKIELENPELNLERGPDGKWNVVEVTKPTPADRPIPTIVVKGATVRVIDRGPDPLPAFTLTDAHVTVLNDPLPVLALQARGSVQGYGSMTARARYNRVTGGVSVGIELPEFPLGEAAATIAPRVAPELAPHLGGLTATAALTADINYAPEAERKWRHDVRLDVKDARFTHPDLPWPAEKLAATVRSVDGRVRVDDASAIVHGARVKLSLETRNAKSETRSAKPDTDPFARIENHLQRLDVVVTGVALTDTVFAQLPESTKEVWRLFSPKGQADLGYKFSRDGTGWKRELELRPRQTAVTYEKFKYPVSDLRGTVRRTYTASSTPTTAIDLRGTAGGQIITINGTVTGDGADPGINVRVSGANLPLDESVIAALPPKYAEMVRRFRAGGRGDFVAEILQQPGVNLCENEFRIEVREATVNHVAFPYPLEKVKGRLVVRTTATDAKRPVRPGEPIEPLPDRDEVVFDGFTALHAGATVSVNGSKRPIPGTRDRKLTLQVVGTNCPVDKDMKAAVAEIKAATAWNTFNPRGRLTFTADVELIDRAPRPRSQGTGDRGQVGMGLAPDPRLLTADLEDPPMNPVTDLKLTFSFSGPTVTPTFFPYELTDFRGWLEYKNGRLDVQNVAGRHGETKVTLVAAEIRFYSDGVIWANVGGLEMKPIIADAALIKALPGRLGPGLEELKLKGGAELLVKHLVVLTPPDAPAGAAASGRREPAVPDSDITATARNLVRARAQSPASAPEPDPVVYWDAELRLAGASIDTGVVWEQVFGAVACRGRYDATHLGHLRGAVWLDRAVIAKQPVTRMSARVQSQPQKPDPAKPREFLPIELEFTDLTGDLFHGVLGGEARIVLAEQTRFNLWLTATDVQLDEVARHYKLGSDADLKGIAQAQLWLYNRLDPATGAAPGRLITEGTGKIDVPTGRMYNLPVLLDLVKVLKLQAPDKTAFEEAHATFRITGDRVKVEQVDLIGKAVCLGGSGELDTSGDYVKFEFYTVGSQVLARMINTPVGDLTAFLSRNLFKIKLTRESGELKYKPEAMPAITEPARAVADRLRARTAKMFGGK